MTLQIALGLPMGLLFGIVLQRGRFCMNTAFREVMVSRDVALFQAYLVAVVVQSVLIQLGASLGLLEMSLIPFYWRAAVVGGLIFGMGMTLAGGCTTGTWYRVGEGMIGSFVALVGFGLSASATRWGLLRPLGLAVRGSTPLEIGGEVPTLANLLNVNPWVIIGLVAAGVAVWVLRRPGKPSLFGWSWGKTGLLIGLLAAAAWYISGLTGRHYGFSITGPTANMVNFAIAREPVPLSWAVFVVLAIPFGAFAAAKWSGEFAWRAPSPKKFPQQFVGGILMGFGAVTAGGCNIGHGLTGLSAFAVSSLVATVFTILGVWTGTYVFFVRRARGT